MRWLGHSQNSIKLFESLEKNCHSSLSMATAWIWRGWDNGSKIFLAIWMELVKTMILGIFLGWGLINATSDSKQLSFCTSNKSYVMQCFDKRMIQYVHMWNGCGNIILDASIHCNNGHEFLEVRVGPPKGDRLREGGLKGPYNLEKWNTSVFEYSTTSPNLSKRLVIIL